ncbi:excinuclease UvrABC ATPase subunit [Nocardiopsis arvandica]|uniref:UvrABC system protein A n=1 Tax=Nocardiopsis sinuspersici TaxID=501010 RepID=A0A7Z0BJK3_9ACTN|nr:excinuclease ABC subunit UvrA [Nocardiopsis sinuspersici]NYH51469.1 excinuclease UvrABC ATPase subunit [Nocardiopsis sinuspersici]
MSIDTARPRPAATDEIVVEGARTHNLRGIDVRIPRNRITVFTGVSGSGKSSLVFDTVAAESRRQLNDTYDSFVRNRLGRPGRPDADRIDNLSVAVVLDQRRLSGNARSTVGTATDIAPLVRLLFSRIGEPSAGLSHVFSFNDPRGMCPECQGLGTVDRVDAEALIDPDLSLDEGAIRFPTFAPGTWRWKRYVHSGLFDRAKPVREYTSAERDLLLYAEGVRPPDPDPEFPRTGTFEGVVPRLARSYLTSESPGPSARDRAALDRVVSSGPCPECGGARLNRTVLDCRIGPHNIAEWCAMPAVELAGVVGGIDAERVRPLAEALVERLGYLDRVGLGYLSLDRASGTLSGGEAQRVRMVRHMGGSLTGLTYVFDEPSTGLHPADVHRLTDLMRRLRDKGNTVLVVEHDPDVIALADHVVDMGPGAGRDGGRVVYEGSVRGLLHADTPTGRYLRGPRAVRGRVRAPRGSIGIRGARLHNLRGVDVSVPTGVLTVVTGVAGSGKSSLVGGELLRVRPDAVAVTQGAVGGGSRSTPATFLGVLDTVRGLFARRNGVAASWFSANSRGACPTCRGRGVIITDLAFLDDVETVCEDCRGTRFNDRALSYTLGGRTIAEVLGMTAVEAAGFLGEPGVEDALGRLVRVGLPYLALGQSLDTLSGGERQRLKLARELAAPASVYVLDEPTAGLHGGDVGRLLALFDHMVDAGTSLVVVEHHLDVVAYADHVIDLGPGAGTHGGRVVFEGAPARMARSGTGATAEALRRYLEEV